jgi:endonuclease G
MEKSALAIFIVALGAIIFEIAVFSVIKADSPWIRALPALVPFVGLIATVLFAVTKDTWIVELARVVNSKMRMFPALLYLSTVLVVAIAVSFGHYVWLAAGAKDGEFIVQVVQKDDVPDQAISGLPVILDHKLKSEILNRPTDKFGKASFEVDANDVFALRILKSAGEDASAFVISSSAQVNEKTKRGFQLIQLSGIPEDSWVRSAKTASVQSFAQFPATFFHWHDNAREQHVINVDASPSAFPFSLPGAETILRREAFSVGFSPLLRLPRWVAYKVVRGQAISRRMDKFMPDPALPSSYQATASDYSNNSFDRGHLVRRSDLFGLGEKATSEVSYMSAVVPQLDFVNQKTWLALEGYTSKKAVPDNEVYVIRGPIFEPAGAGKMVNVTLMGANLIPVPTHFFQILFISNGLSHVVEAYIVPNKYTQVDSMDVTPFQSSVRTIAERTGLVFDAELMR